MLPLGFGGLALKEKAKEVDNENGTQKGNGWAFRFHLDPVLKVKVSILKKKIYIR